MNLHFDTGKYLVEADANVDNWTWRGENALYSAVDMNTLPHGRYSDRPTTDDTSSLEMIEILLEAGATPLLRAAKGHGVPAIELLLEHGAHVDLPNRDETTPLMAAAGVQANSIDTRGDYTTPLVAQNSAATIEALLSGGADINQTDRIGRTALHGAAGWGWDDAVQVLADNGADLHAEE